MITGMDRLKAALAGQAEDRIPVFCNLIDQGVRELGLTPEAYYSSGEHVARAQLRLREKFGYDNVWSLFYVGKEAELMGCRKIAFARGGPPNVEDYVIQSIDDIGRLEVPESLGDHPAFAEVGRCLEILREEVGGANPICAYITASMALPALLMGMENWMELLFLGEPAARDALLAKCHALFVKEVEAYRRGGADVLIYSNPFASTDVVPYRFFLEQSLPWIERDVRAVGAFDLVFYCGTARTERVAASVLERTGMRAVYAGPQDNLTALKAALGDNGLTCGVINDIRLIDCSEAEVRAEVRRILAAGMPGGRFAFGTAVMPCAIPETNIRAMVEEACEFGRTDKEVA